MNKYNNIIKSVNKPSVDNLWLEDKQDGIYTLKIFDGEKWIEVQASISENDLANSDTNDTHKAYSAAYSDLKYARRATTKTFYAAKLTDRTCNLELSKPTASANNYIQRLVTPTNSDSFKWDDASTFLIDHSTTVDLTLNGNSRLAINGFFSVDLKKDVELAIKVYLGGEPLNTIYTTGSMRMFGSDRHLQPLVCDIHLDKLTADVSYPKGTALKIVVSLRVISNVTAPGVSFKYPLGVNIGGVDRNMVVKLASDTF